MSIDDYFGLPKFEIVGLHEFDDDIRIDVINLFEPTYCVECRVFFPTFHKHSKAEHVFLDTPLRGKRVGLHVNRQRYKCGGCGRTFYEPLEDIHITHRMTNRLVDWIVKEAPTKTFAQLGRETGAVEGTMRKIYNGHVTQELRKRPFVTPRVLGIDEIYLRTVHGVFTNIEEGLLLDIIPSNKQADVELFFATLDRDKVEFVTMDMCTSYRGAVQAMFPMAKVVADRFHIQKCAIRCLEDYRKKLRIDLTPDDRKVLKRERFVLTKRKYDLNDYEHDQSQKWFTKFPELEEVYLTKEKYMDMWSCSNRHDAETRYDEWLKDLSPKMKKVYKELWTPMKNWREEIFRYFECGYTNAKTEAINGRIRQLYNDGRSYSFEVLRGKLLLSVGMVKNDVKRYNRRAKPADPYAMGRMTAWSTGVSSDSYDEVETPLGIDISTLLNMSNDEFFKL